MVTIGSVVINVADVPTAAEFWAQALGYAPREGADAGWAMVIADGGKAPNLTFDRSDRTHLDLYLAPGETQARRSSGSSVSARPAWRTGRIRTVPTSWCWPIPWGTCSAWSARPRTEAGQ